MSVGAGGRLAWLPQETIVFDNSAFRRTIEVDLAADAEALIVEATVFGRRAMGESVAQAHFADRWRVRRAGRLSMPRTLPSAPSRRAAAAPPSLGGAIALRPSLSSADDAEQQLDAVRAVLGDAGGASAWRVAGSGKLLARLIAEDGYALRKRLIPLIELLNGRAGLPKVWTL